MFTFFIQAVLGLFDRLVAVCHGRTIDLRGFNPSWANPVTGGEDNWLVTPRWWRYCTSAIVLGSVDHYRAEDGAVSLRTEVWMTVPIRSFQEWVASPGAYGVVELPDGSFYELRQHRLWSRDSYGFLI